MKTLIITISIFITIFLTACDNGTDPSTTNELVGKWITRENYNHGDSVYQKEMEFKSDYTFRNTFTTIVHKSTTKIEYLNGTYNVTGNKLTVFIDDGSNEVGYYYYSILDKSLLKMYLKDYSDSITYVREN